MKTKVIILGEQPREKKLNPIEFDVLLTEEGEVEAPTVSPSDWDNIELICRNYQNSDYDLMFAYDGTRSKGTAYLGSFNDGVVE